VPDGSEDAMVVGPVDPAQGCHFHSRRAGPRSLPPDDLGLLETIDGLGQSVVVSRIRELEIIRIVEQSHLPANDRPPSMTRTSE